MEGGSIRLSRAHYEFEITAPCVGSASVSDWLIYPLSTFVNICKAILQDLDRYMLLGLNNKEAGPRNSLSKEVLRSCIGGMVIGHDGRNSVAGENLEIPPDQGATNGEIAGSRPLNVIVITSSSSDSHLSKEMSVIKAPLL
jgi:hypothetical protein